jgi:hypothetical protein
MFRSAERKVRSGLNRAAEIRDLADRYAGDRRRQELERALALARQATATLPDVHGDEGYRVRVYALLVEGETLSALGLVGDALTQLGLAALLMRSKPALFEPRVADGVDGLIADCYWQLGDPATAARFARLAGSPDLVAMLFDAGDPQVAELVDKMNTAGGPLEPAATVFAHLLGIRPATVGALQLTLGELNAAQPRLAIYARRALSDAFSISGNHAQALQVLVDGIGSQASTPAEEPETFWTDARLEQALASALVAAGEFASGLDTALGAWAKLESRRYQTPSTRLRSAAYSSYSSARRAALDACLWLGDARGVLELLEASRLQAQPLIAGDAAELRVAGVDPGGSDGMSAPPPQPAEPGWMEVPEPYSFVLADTFESRTELSVPPEIQVDAKSVLADARRRHAALSAQIGLRGRVVPLDRAIASVGGADAIYWASWVEEQVLYWGLWRSGKTLGAGSFRPCEHRSLFDSIATLAAMHAVESPWSTGAEPSDALALLNEAESVDERELTDPLTELLPPALRQAITDAEIELVISPAPEISFLPWPIIPLDSDSGLRLIERATLRFMPSAAAVDPVRAHTETVNQPFLITCDDPMGDLIPSEPRPALRRFGSADRAANHDDVEVATAAAVIAALQELEAGTPGLAFFRGHASWDDNDPTQSSLVMVGGDGIPAGLLFAHDTRTGRPAVPLPNTVVLSCCSTSGLRGRHGGEALGLVAGCLAAGASRIYSTNVDLLETPETCAMDDQLIAAALAPGDHFHRLRAVQLKRLEHWRTDSDANPATWAHFQAFGVAPRK